MSHSILLNALAFVAEADYSYEAKRKAPLICILLPAQRQLFNSLAPVLPAGFGSLTPWAEPEHLFRLLMRADTFRFATSLCVGYGMSTSLTQHVLSKMDFVMSVETASIVVGNKLVKALMSLPHLERVTVRPYGEIITEEVEVTSYQRIRAFLKHPRESVRRSVAASAHAEWFHNNSAAQRVAVLRDDLIPLLDSSRCNGATYDYLLLVEEAMLKTPPYIWEKLPLDVIMLLGERLYQFFTAASSHAELIDMSLKMLGKLAAGAIRHSAADWHIRIVLVDVFKEWPGLELLPDMIRRGVVLSGENAVGAVVHALFDYHCTRAPLPEIRRHQQRFFDLQLPDLMYDAYVNRTGKSPFQQDYMTRGYRWLPGVDPPLHERIFWHFRDVCGSDPVSFLNTTTVFQKELQRFLIPWHRDVMTWMLRLQRQGQRFVGASRDTAMDLLDDFPWRNFVQRTGGARFILEEVLDGIFGYRSQKTEVSEVLRLLFDEHTGLNIGPILQSFVLVVQSSYLAFNVKKIIESLQEAEQRRRSREECDIDCCYLADFLECFRGVTFHEYRD